MWVTAVTVQVLFLGATAVLRTLPELAQVGRGVASRIIAAQGARHAGAATGAVVGRPDQPVVLVVAIVLRVAAPRAALARDGGLGGGAAEHVACRVVGQALVGERAACQVALLPLGRRSPS